MDGAYGEASGLIAKGFVEIYTGNYLLITLSKNLLTKKKFDEWPTAISSEINLDEGNGQQESLKQFKNGLNNCIS